MKKTILSLLLCFFGLLAKDLQAQVLSVASGSGFNIKSGTVVSAAGLDLTPSADFSLKASLSSGTTVSNTTTIPTIKRSYQFSATTAAFSGVLKINYQDSELNGHTESSLKLLYNNGSAWTLDNSSTNDATANYVNSNLTAITLSELSLGNSTSLTVDENPIVAKFNVMAYPNPFSSSFKLAVTTSSLERVKVSVYDVTGRLIEQHNIAVSEIANQEIGDHYPSGVYHIIITQESESKTLRVIKRLH